MSSNHKKYINFVYQLNCNQEHSAFFFIEFFKNSIFLKLFKESEGKSKILSQYKLKE